MAVISKSNELVNPINEVVEEFLSPDITLIPYCNGAKLKVQTNDEILKEEVLFQINDAFVLSPISGILAGAKKSVSSNGELTPCIVIQNDYKEKVLNRKGIKKSIDKLTKEELISSLKELGIPNMYHHNTFLYELLEKYANANKLIVSGVDLDPSFAADSYIMRDYLNEILETTDALVEILNIKKCYIVLKNNDNENIIKYTEYLGTFPKIKLKLVSAEYPKGLEHILKTEIFSSDTKDEDILFLGCQNIIALYNALKRNRPITEKYITIAGPLLKESKVIKAKIGSYLDAIIKNNIEINTDKKIAYYVNGFVCGVEVNIENTYLSPATTGIFISESEIIAASECITCGKCYAKCPIGINPKFIMDNINSPEKLKNSNVNKCITCGLCTYNCPANIPLREYLKRGLS